MKERERELERLIELCKKDIVNGSFKGYEDHTYIREGKLIQLQRLELLTKELKELKK